tara:strand:+ start:463 stop:921 length:459 start_codon:yes stop_codon:yes gene_type:complete
MIYRLTPVEDNNEETLSLKTIEVFGPIPPSVIARREMEESIREEIKSDTRYTCNFRLDVANDSAGTLGKLEELHRVGAGLNLPFEFNVGLNNYSAILNSYGTDIVEIIVDDKSLTSVPNLPYILARHGENALSALESRLKSDQERLQINMVE